VKVLHISSKPPYPTIDGGCYASARLLECLNTSDNEVYHLTISTEKHPFNLSDYPKKISESINIQNVFIRTKISKWKALLNLFSSSSYLANRFNSVELSGVLTKYSNQSFDVITLDGLYTALNIEQIKSQNKSKIFYRAHNLEYQIWEDLSQNTSNLFKKWYYKKTANNLKKFEKRVLASVDLIWAISETDKFKIEKHTNHPVSLLLVAIPDGKSNHSYEKNNIFHLGSMNWTPNREAVLKLQKILAKQKFRNEEITLNLAGSGGEIDSFKNLTWVNQDGLIPDPEEYAHKNGILVSLLESGSGIRIKLLEMMSFGIPIISTTKGAEGIKDLTTLLIADSDQEIEDGLELVINNQEFREKIGRKAQKYIKTNHSKDSVIQQIKSDLELF